MVSEHMLQSKMLLPHTSRYSRAWQTAMMALQTASGPIPAGSQGTHGWVRPSNAQRAGLCSGKQLLQRHGKLHHLAARSPAGHRTLDDLLYRAPRNNFVCGCSAPVMLGQPPSRARLEMAPATTVGLLLLPAVSSLGCGSAAGKGSGKEQGEVRHRPSMATSSGDGEAVFTAATC